MRQLALPILGDATPTLASYIPGPNSEALAAVRRLADEAARGMGMADSAAPHLLYLWGETGSGKTHLLQGLHGQLAAVGLPVRWIDGRRSARVGDFAGACLLVDNVDGLVPECADQLFHAWNRVRDHGGLIACAGPAAPAALPLAAEVTSRLAWGQVYRLARLDEQALSDALRAHARARGMPLPTEVLDYLLTRAPRHLPTLLHLLEALDVLSLSTQRAITVPLVRALLAAPDRDLPLEP